jgi:DNA transformation protein
MIDKDTIADLFSAFGPVTIRRMFSGYGLYSDGVCFALHLRDAFFLKADAATIPAFEAENVRPFSYTARGKTVTVNSFWRMPERLYDDPDELAQWARAAVDAARRVQAAKAKRKPIQAGKKKRPTAKESKATEKPARQMSG